MYLNRVPIFVINLKKDVKKKQYMDSLCKEKKLKIEFIKAIDGNSLNTKAISKLYSKELALKYMGRALTKGEIATVLSHLSIYKKMINENIAYSLVLEDDIEIDMTYNDLIEIIKNLPLDWECVLLGHHPGYSIHRETASSVWRKYKITSTIECIRFAEPPFGAYGYLINLKGAKKRLQNFSIIFKPIDHWKDTELNLYGIKPVLVRPNLMLLNASSLKDDRDVISKMISRTFMQRIKDKVRVYLSYLKLLEVFLILRSLLRKILIPKKFK